MAERRGLRLVLAVLVACAAWSPAAAATSDADRARALTAEARGLYSQGSLSAAAGKLETALGLCPDHVPAEELLAVSYQAQGSPERALPHYWAVQRASLPPLPERMGERQVRTRELLVECEGILDLWANQERLKARLPLCLPDPLLARIARQHSEEMRDLNYFSHESPTAGLRTITDRFKRQAGGLQVWALGENIARRYGRGMYCLSPEGVRKTHQEWMDSPGHRANILDKRLTRFGIGVSVNDNGDYWATQFFAKYYQGTE